jgi:hypothetical protein
MLRAYLTAESFAGSPSSSSWPSTPFSHAMPARVDRAVSWPTPNGMTEQIIGIAPIAPLMILGTLFAIVLALTRGPKDVATRTALQLTAGAWLIVFGLSTCWWIVAHYSLDFMMLMSVASVVCIETIVTSLRATTIRIAPLRAFIAALACYSIVTAILLGFAGPGDGFRRANPKVFERVSGWSSSNLQSADAQIDLHRRVSRCRLRLGRSVR